MNTVFEKNGGKYEMQGDYKLPCVASQKIQPNTSACGENGTDDFSKRNIGS